MHWKLYSEAHGRPPSAEVVITLDERDVDHPYVVSRRALYESAGKKVVLRVARPKVRKDRGQDRPTAPAVKA